eukprot:5286448-Alexandrium_andersonii.AAC.1
MNINRPVEAVAPGAGPARWQPGLVLLPVRLHASSEATVGMVAPAHEAGLPGHLALGSHACNDKAPLDDA